MGLPWQLNLHWLFPHSERFLQLLHSTYDPLDYYWSSKEHVYLYRPSVNLFKVGITSYMSLVLQAFCLLHLTFPSDSSLFNPATFTHLPTPSTPYFCTFLVLIWFYFQSRNWNVQEMDLYFYETLTSFSNSSFAIVEAVSVHSVFSSFLCLMLSLSCIWGGLKYIQSSLHSDSHKESHEIIWCLVVVSFLRVAFSYAKASQLSPCQAQKLGNFSDAI